MSENLERTPAGTEARNVAGALTSMKIDELISNLAIGIAQGQMKLDQASMKIARFMADAQVAFGKKAGSDEPDLLSLIELGFTPNFYQFVDTILEVRVSISTNVEEQRSYESSETILNQSELNAQQSYENASQSSGYGYGYSNNWGVGGGWWNVGWAGAWGVGGHSSGSGWGNNYANQSQEKSSSSYMNKNLSVSTVDASYSQKYNYAVEGSSVIKTKIVPVPPPTVLEEIIRSKVQQRREWENRQRARFHAEQKISSVLDLVNNFSSPSVSVTTKRDDPNISDLSLGVKSIQEGLDALSSLEWSMVGLSYRQNTDNALNSMIASVNIILNNFETEDPKGIVDVQIAKDAVENIKNQQGMLSKTLTDILGVLKDKPIEIPPDVPSNQGPPSNNDDSPSNGGGAE